MSGLNPTDQDWNDLLKDFDSNEDGLISMDEFNAYLKNYANNYTTANPNALDKKI